jgi:hypothetical protein
MNRKLFIILYFTFNLYFLCTAQTLENKNEDSANQYFSSNYENSLNGHRFISNSFIKSPFINTYLQTILGAGKTSLLELPVIVIKGEPLYTLKGDLAFTYLGFEYQHAVKDWIAFSGKFDVVGRMGTDAQALLSDGVNLRIGFEFGWLVKLYIDKEMMLSGSAKISNSNFTIIDIYGFAQGIIDSGTITPENALVKSTPVTVAAVGLSYAYTINKMFGLTAFSSIGYGESVERYSEDEWYLNYGLSADADLNPDHSVPIGFALSYFGQTRGKNTASLLGDPQNILFQINYTGKSDLDLGLVFNYQWYNKASTDQTITFTNIFLDIKYYF